MPVLLFTKNIMDVDKPVPVINIPPVRFMDDPPKQVIIANTQGD